VNPRTGPAPLGPREGNAPITPRAEAATPARRAGGHVRLTGPGSRDRCHSPSEASPGPPGRSRGRGPGVRQTRSPLRLPYARFRIDETRTVRPSRRLWRDPGRLPCGRGGARRAAGGPTARWRGFPVRNSCGPGCALQSRGQRSDGRCGARRAKTGAERLRDHALVERHEPRKIEIRTRFERGRGSHANWPSHQRAVPTRPPRQRGPPLSPRRPWLQAVPAAINRTLGAPLRRIDREGRR
jgi:hypothetical protein